MKTTVLPVLAMLLLASCLDQSPGRASAEEQACSRDEECAVVDFGCDCGGGKVAVHVDAADAVLDRWQNTTVCTLGRQEPPLTDSCRANDAICVFGTCTSSSLRRASRSEPRVQSGEQAGVGWTKTSESSHNADTDRSI